MNFLENKTFDALLIDGPAFGKRLKILDSGIDFEQFKIIIIDDVERKEDRLLFEYLRKGKQCKLTDEYGVIFNDQYSEIPKPEYKNRYLFEALNRRIQMNWRTHND